MTGTLVANSINEYRHQKGLPPLAEYSIDYAAEGRAALVAYEKRQAARRAERALIEADLAAAQEQAHLVRMAAEAAADKRLRKQAKNAANRRNRELKREENRARHSKGGK